MFNWEAELGMLREDFRYFIYHYNNVPKFIVKAICYTMLDKIF